MSKFFDSTQQTRNSSVYPPTTAGIDIASLLPPVDRVQRVHGDADSTASSQIDSLVDEQVSRMVAPAAESCVGKCRRVEFSLSPQTLTFSEAEPTHSAAVEGYRALRTRLMTIQAARGMGSLVIASSIPEEGKTLTLVNLARCRAQLQDTPVLVIDADLRTAGLRKYLPDPGAPGLAEILVGTSSYEEGIVRTDVPMLYAVNAGEADVPAAELLAGSRWTDFMAWAKSRFKVILVDSPPILGVSDFELISAACDGILLVVRSLRTERTVLQKAAASVQKNKLVGAVCNGS